MQTIHVVGEGIDTYLTSKGKIPYLQFEVAVGSVCD